MNLKEELQNLVANAAEFEAKRLAAEQERKKAVFDRSVQNGSQAATNDFEMITNCLKAAASRGLKFYDWFVKTVTERDDANESAGWIVGYSKAVCAYYKDQGLSAYENSENDKLAKKVTHTVRFYW